MTSLDPSTRPDPPADSGPPARSDRPDHRAVLRRARAIADLFDRRFRVPGTGWRFGLDPIIGLLPVAGDTLTALVSLYVVFEAVRLRLGAGVVLRMLGNVVIDWLLGLVPLVDVVLDTAFKANVRNARLLEDALRERGGD